MVMMLVGASISFGLAWISWHVFEGPILGLKGYFPANTGKRTAPVVVHTHAIIEGKSMPAQLVGPAAS